MGRTAVARIENLKLKTGKAMRRETYGYTFKELALVDVRLENINNTEYFWKEDMEENPWLRFQQFLEKFRPSVGFGQFDWVQQMPPAEIKGPVSLTSAPDDAMNAYSRDALHFLLPIVESSLDDLSFWNQALPSSALIGPF